uniref:Large ribosomal subunit protein uL4c n=1 Tax=Thalassiosira sp. TaxID=1891026 RepID=A0A8K1YHC8_9STRA|nr:ribosomal protein L4 [Thalassiosira sp.]
MAVQKIANFFLLSKNEITPPKIEVKFNILENSANYLIHRDILRHQHSQKQETVSTKTRSEVRGGGKKPWQQKGTGRARAGSNRSPLWRGGGVIFGPKPKTTTLKLNKKERNLALQTLLYNKRKNISLINDNELDILMDKPKTKEFCKICKDYNIDVDQKILLIVHEKTTDLKLSTQNVKNVELISASNLNTLSLLNAKQILITVLAMEDIKEIYCNYG